MYLLPCNLATHFDRSRLPTPECVENSKWLRNTDLEFIILDTHLEYYIIHITYIKLFIIKYFKFKVLYLLIIIYKL